MTTKLLAFHGDPKIKEKYLARLAEHRRLDHLTQGVGWESNGTTKGCAIGCTFEKYDHNLAPKELGWPAEIAHLEDAIFEDLPQEEALAWPQACLDAPRVGADLSLVWPRFAVWLLVDPEHGVVRFTKNCPEAKKAIRDVADLFRRWVNGKRPSNQEFSDAARAARDAARKTFWRDSRDELLRLLREAPVPKRARVKR